MWKASRNQHLKSYWANKKKKKNCATGQVTYRQATDQATKQDVVRELLQVKSLFQYFRVIHKCCVRGQDKPSFGVSLRGTRFIPYVKDQALQAPVKARETVAAFLV